MDKQIREISKNRTWKRILQRSVALLCAVVILFTMNTLKRNANTLERIAMCGYAEHVHSASCFSGDVLVCGMEEHIHTDACYQESPASMDMDDLDIEVESPIVDDTVEELDLSLALDDLDLVTEDVTAEPVSNEVEEKVYSLGTGAMVSHIIGAVGLGVSLSEIIEVAAVENDEAHSGLIAVEKVDGDYRVWAKRDFAEAELALIITDGIYVVKLTDGIAQREDATPEVQPAIEDAPAVQIGADAPAELPAMEDAPAVDAHAGDDDHVEVPVIEDEAPVDGQDEDTLHVEDVSPEAEQQVGKGEQLDIEDVPGEQAGDQGDEQPAGEAGEAQGEELAVEEADEEQPAEEAAEAQDEEQPSEEAGEAQSEEPAVGEAAEGLSLEEADEAQGEEQPSEEAGEAQSEEPAVGEAAEGLSLEEADEAQGDEQPAGEAGEAQGDGQPAEEADEAQVDGQPAEGSDEEQGEEQPAEEADEAQVDGQPAEGSDEEQGEEQPAEGSDEAQVDGQPSEEADEAQVDGQPSEEADEEQPSEEAADEQSEEEVAEEQATGESESPVYTATIDLAEVEAYPLSLNAMLAAAKPEAAEAEEAAVEGETGEEAAVEEEADAEANPTPIIEYDAELLEVVEQDGDWLVTPIRDFEETRIAVDNGSRYELTLVNCVLADEAGEEQEEQPEEQPAPVYTATVDLTDATYPLSLNAMLATVTPALDGEQAAQDDEQPAEAQDDEQPAEAQSEEQPAERPTPAIEYDEALLEIAESDGDHLITPIQSFENTRIIVDNGSRYELTLVNCVLTDEGQAEQPEAAYPAQDFEGRTDYVKVTVSAPEGAFPEGTKMAVADVEDEKTLTDIEDTVSEEFVEVKRVHAVDITFTDAEGNEIEPLLPISVVMRVEEKEQQQEAVVVHVDDAGETEVVESQSEAPAGETEVKVEMPATDAPAAGEAQEGETEGSAVGFEADTFSVYAVVITETIETKYIDAEGATWNISVGYGPEAEIPAGATLAVEEVEGDYLEQTAELLKGKETITLARFFDITILDAEGNPVQPARPVEVKATLAEQSEDAVKAVHFAEEGPEIIEASQDEDAVSFDAASFSVYGIVYTVDFHYGVDGETYEFTLPGGGAVGMRELAPALGLVADAEEDVALFVENIENVAFSNEDLVKAVPVEMNMTVGALKQKYELESEVSAELTEAQLAELNDKVLRAPDWALVSLKPFNTDETLTITMKSGEVITVAVTDAQLQKSVISANGETYVITVTYGEDAEIPGDAELKVREILPVDDEYADYLKKAQRAASGEASADEAEEDADAGEEAGEANGEGEYARFFDIEIWANDQKVEPAAAVTVDIALADAPQTGEALKVVHFDEANGPVVMQTEAGEEGEDEAVTEAAKVRFETDGFSVYGVIVGVPAPTDVNDLAGRTYTIKHTKNSVTNYVTSSVIASEINTTLSTIKKSSNQNDAAAWMFEPSNVPGKYYISTVINGEKKYMHLDINSTNPDNANGTLSSNPQSFSISLRNDNTYRIIANIDGNDYYLNEFRDDKGFAAYKGESGIDDNLVLTYVPNPSLRDVEQYMLITQYEGEYYIVLNDGRLEKAEKMFGDPVSGEFTTPMTWTWDGSHLFHNSLAVGYTNDQRASDFYRRYIDPSADTGLSQEHGKYADGTAADPEQVKNEKNNIVYVIVGPENQKHKTVSDRRAAMQETSFSITGEAAFKIYSGSDYMGVVKDADGNLKLTGKKGVGEATNFWFADANKLSGQGYVTLEMVDYPVDGEQYYLVIKRGNNYAIINPDRSLSANNVAKYDNQLTFATPDQMKLWTYTANTAVENKDQISCVYNGKTWYLNPYQDIAITDYLADDNGANHDGIKIDHNNNNNGHHQIRGTSEKFFNIENNILSGKKSNQGNEVHFAKLISANDMHYSDNGFPAMENHMVNHIDISIQGLTEVNVPLNYGVYKYMDAETGALLDFNVSSTTNLSLKQKVDITEEDIKKGTVEAYVERANGTYDYKDNLFTITGYSANEKTEYSTDQVRIEGNFKVADLEPRISWDTRDSNQTRQDRLDNKVYYTVTVTKPVTFPLIDKDRGQIYNSDGEPLSITLEMTYSASFNYWDWNGVGAEHNNECPPLQPGNLPKINGNDAGAYVAFYNDTNNSFVKWQGTPNKDGYIVDPDGNYIYHKKGSDPQGWPEYCNDPECGNHTNDWERVQAAYKSAGGIGGWGNSGMDFVLGGDAGDVNSKVVALNITKKVVDEQGNLISVKTPMTNVFDIYYNRDGEENAVARNSAPVWNEKTKTWQVNHDNTSGLYNGYTKLHSKTITVGSAGMGLIYDYSVKPGMFYIEESQSEEDLPRKILDTKNQEWEYVKTYIETEYVWRDSNDKDNMFHVTGDYTANGTAYQSIPEVLGEYHRPNGSGGNTDFDDSNNRLRNGFLRYYVYNVYRPKPINIQVEKEWKWQNDSDTPEAPNSASLNVTLGRYKLEDIQGYTAKGTLTITDSFTGIDSGYNAMYTITDPDGNRIDKYYASDYVSGTGIVLTGLKGGQYVISKVVPGKDNYSIRNDTQKIIVNLPQNGNGSAAFNQTKYTEITDPENWVTVGIRVSYPFDDGGTTYNDGTFNTGLKMKVPANSEVEFTYRKFQAYNSQNQPYQADAGYWCYDWTTEGTPHWECRYNYQNCPDGQMVTVPVGDKDVCIMILYGDENVAPSMGIRFRQAEQSAPTNAANRFSAPRANSIVNKTQPNAEGIPASPIEGMAYEPDGTWQKQVTLNNGNSWKDWLKENSQKLDLDEYDERGNRYVYYIVKVDEYNIPAETQIVYDRSYTTTVDSETGVITYTFTVTNKMPDKTKVRIKKVSALNPSITLGGASFDLYKQNGNGGYDKVQEGIVTSAEGYSSEIEVSRGHYKLVETEAPSGYIKTGDDPEFDVTANANGEIVVTYESSETNEILVQNEPLGALKITKVVTINDEAPTTDAQKALTNGIYEFSIVGSDAATSGQNHALRISFYNGRANGYELDGIVSSVSGTDNRWAVLVPNLIPGRYTITETGSDNALMTFKSVTGGNDDGDEANKRITVTVVAGDSSAGEATAQVVFTNNREVVDIDATKTWTNNGNDVTAQLKNASVTFTLQSRSDDGDEWATAAVTAAANGNEAMVELKTTGAASSDLSAWKVSWTNLPKYDASGNLIQYQVVESQPKVGTDNLQLPAQASAVAGNYGAVDGHANPAATVSLTNPLPTTEITVKKTWSQTSNWPDAHIQVGMTLKADGNEATGLPGYTTTVHNDATGTDEQVTVPSQYALVWLTSANAADGHTWHNLPVYTGEGKKIVYSVEETGMKYKPDSEEAIDLGNSWKDAFTTNPSTYFGNLDDNSTVTIDNTPKTTAINVTKVWTQNKVARTDKTDIGYELHKVGADDAIAVDAANIAVDKGEMEVGKVKYVTGENGGWQTVTISGLPQYELVIGEESGTATATYSLVNYYVIETGVTGDTRVTYKANAGAEQGNASDANTNDGTIRIYNRDAKVDINVLKVDATEENKKLEDAEFQILKYKDESERYVAYDFLNKAFVTTVSGDASTQNAGDSSKKKTDANGALSFTGLPAGQYKLVETKTPDGYIKVDNNDIYFTISADGVVKWTKADGTEINNESSDGDKPNQVSYASNTFTVGNTPGASLPATGGPGTTLYYVTGSALLLLAIATLIFRRKASDE